MSKKTRKKSPKTSAGKPARAKTISKTASKPKSTSKSASKSTSKKPASTSAKTGQAKTTKATAKKSAKGASKTPGNVPAKASHKAPSKPLKPISHSEPVAPVVTASKPPAPKPLVVKPPVDKASNPKTDAAAPRQLGLSEGAKEGGKAPAFRLPRDGGDSVSLSDFKGTNLVLFFYPRADTPGCTKEAIDFSRLSGAFAENQTAVVGVSADPLKAQEAFRNKHELVTPLVSDEQHEMLDAYGAWGEKSMYGRTFLGVLRTTVLVGADGRIIRIWRNVKVDGHADEVLAAVRAL